MSASLVNFVERNRGLIELSSTEKKKLKELEIEARKSSDIIDELTKLGVINMTIKSPSSSSVLNRFYDGSYRGWINKDSREYHILIDINNGVNRSIIRKYKESIENLTEYQNRLVREGKSLPRNSCKYEFRKKQDNSLETCHLNKLEYYGEILSNMPITNLSEIKKLADILGFIIIPIEYSNDLVYSIDEKIDSHKLEAARDKFKELFKEYGDTYILCPLKFIDLLKVSKSSKDLDNIYYGSKVSIHGITINLNIPVFRTIFSQIDILNDRIDDIDKRYDNRIKDIKGNISEMQKSLNSLTDQVNQEINKRVQKLEKEVKVLDEWRIQCLQDPMIFKCREFKDDSECLIGFSWGPEFSDGFIKEFNMNVNDIKDIKRKFYE